MDDTQQIKMDQAVVSPPWTAAKLTGGRVWLVQVLLLAMAGAYLFAPIVAKLVKVWWTSENHSYGALIPLASAYFAWDKRAILRGVRRSPSPWAIPAVLAAVLLFGAGTLGTIFGLQAAGLVLYVWVIVLSVWGIQVARILIFPLGFLLFLVPVPAAFLDRIAPPLQLFAANFAGWVLEGVRIPVLIDGTYIHLPRAVLHVAVACAGLRFLVSTTLLGVVVAYWGQRTPGRRLLVAALAVPIAILANASRVAVTGVLAYAAGAETAMGFFHTFSGSVVFWMGVAGLIGISAAIRRIGR